MPPSHPLSTLRQFLQPRPTDGRCELCGGALAAEHPHLLEPDRRRLLCCCDACAILFSSQQGVRYLRVPRRVEIWPDFRLTDAQWEGLHLPINLAFFVRGTAAGRVRASYPSPAGAVESLLTLEAWQALVADNPILATLEPEVEALLVNRLASPEYFRAPIDECYRLVGRVRASWRGLSGGPEVRAEIERFFGRLRSLARPSGAGPAGESLRDARDGAGAS